ncbi:amino acid adenylation domain-containing protein [Paenibacillus sp. ACRRX]|uniref:non-ribosomal peptide synthetase family protein n=1 Tax=Paenibacillus sp. ACRRX TaxID=2918206 RepID=UPI001EF6A4B1|nr:non-ribosomal peptide synthetase [Paenibacillus sp. ACRRX]MCG7408864.1 amino acid adenylation domain-containing protein [Paenibacillus sp. ACRRX]
MIATSMKPNTLDKNTILPMLQVPLDAARHLRTYDYTEVSFDFSGKWNGKLAAATQAGQLHALLTAAYMVWVYRISGEKELMVATNSMERPLSAVFATLEGGQTFQALTDFIQGQLASSPLLHESSETDSVFQVNAQSSRDVKPIIEWNVHTAKQQFLLNIRYDQSLLQRATVERYAVYFSKVLDAVINDPKVLIGGFDILTEDDHKVYGQLNNTYVDYPTEQTIHGMFEAAVNRFASRTAISSLEASYSYAELNARANQVAHMLLAKGLRKGDFVTIYMDRSLETVISLLGIMKAGGAYVPVDPEHPEERNQYIVEDTKSAFIVTKVQFADKAAHLSSTISTVKELVHIDADLSVYSSADPAVDVQSDDLAYIIYTSGSTGKPKGALIAHKGVVNLGFVVQQDCHINEHEVLTQFATYSFDASVWDTVGALFFGAHLYLLSAEERVSVEEFAEAIARTNTTIITILPTVFFNQLAAHLSDEGYKKLSKVKLITVAGEALYGEQVRAFQRKFGEQIEIVNVYGPTECTVCTTTHKVSELVPETLSNIPIGKPISNYKVYIVNENDQLCPVNVPGEIYISTVGLAKGYLNQPERTEQSFVASPFEASELVYKSGDIARLLADGTIEYVTRKDSQIKIRGHRIEIGEIEDKLAQYPNVQDVAIVAKKDDEDQNVLAAFFTTKDQSQVSIADVRLFLADKLPSYFVPKYMTQLEGMPISPTGKIDRKGLAAMQIEQQQLAERVYVAPVNETQRKIAEAWEQVLHVKPIGIHDNFFEVGGDSLRVIHVLALLKPHFPNLRINDFFQYKLLSELAERVQILSELSSVTEEEQSAEWIITDLNEHPVRLESQLDAQDFKQPQHVLLTGATGYLGSHILFELLKRTDATVYCLVRPSTPGASLSRLQDTMKQYFGETVATLMKDRVQAVEGDLERDHLGLSEDDQDLLRSCVDTIIHSAADVRHFGDVAQFAKTNVAGTKFLLDMAMAKQGVRFHHVSTMGIPEDLALEGKWDAALQEQGLATDLAAENVYTNSKLEAEKLLFAAAKQGAAVNIYRAGNLTCHSEHGRFQKNIDSNAFYRMIKAMLLLGKAPQANWYVDFTPIDYASQSIVALALRPDTIGQVFHICNPQQVLYADFIELINRCGYDVELMKFNAYSNWLFDAAIPKDTEALHLAMAQLEGDGAKNSNYRYGCMHTAAALAETEVECAPVDEGFIRRMIEHAVAVGYFPQG